jgi:hypothetical protein
MRSDSSTNSHTPREEALPPEIREILRGGDGEGVAHEATTEGHVTPSRTRAKRNPAADARLRATILRQLMETHFTKSQREKLLKMLIALGISETEYRALVIKLGEMDVARKAEQQQARQEPLVVEEVEEAEAIEPAKVAVPTIKSEGLRSGEKPPSQDPSITRAELYRRLRDESPPKLKGA